jgi:hypothetical protein
MEKYKLYNLLEYLHISDTDKLIERSLDYFRQCYRERPLLYPGDKELYLLFERCIKQGLDINASYELTLNTIKREMILYDAHSAIGKGYYPILDPSLRYI